MFNLYRIREEDDHAEWSSLPAVDALPMSLTKDEIRKEQSHDDFCQQVLEQQNRKTSAFFEDHDGLLKRRPRREDFVQIVLPETLRA